MCSGTPNDPVHWQLSVRYACCNCKKHGGASCPAERSVRSQLSFSALGLRGDRIAACRKPWKLVADFEPLDLIVRPNVVIRPDSFRLVKAPYSNLNSIGKHLFVHRNGAAAFRTKATLSEIG
jgi:hypothetical protein